MCWHRPPHQIRPERSKPAMFADVLDTFDAGEADNKPGSTTPAAMVYAGPDWSLGDLLSDHVAGMSASGAQHLWTCSLVTASRVLDGSQPQLHSGCSLQPSDACACLQPCLQ